MMNFQAMTGIAAVIIGIAYSIQAYHLPRATVGNPLAPMVFPLILGLLMLVCGIILLVKEGMKKKEVTADQEKEKAKPKGLTRSTKLIIFTCVSSVIYALLFERIGYVLSTLLFMSSILFALNGKEKWKTNIIVATCFSISIYVVFLKLLSISLPLMPILEI